MKDEEKAACEHVWKYGNITLDMAPDGIHHRVCRKCYLVQQLGPFASEGWKEDKRATDYARANNYLL